MRYCDPSNENAHQQEWPPRTRCMPMRTQCPSWCTQPICEKGITLTVQDGCDVLPKVWQTLCI